MQKEEIKSQLLEQCIAFIDQRIDVSQKAIDAAQDSANQEGKSSMGDKYETGRSRMQLQKDQHSRQLNEALKVRMVLDLLDPGKAYETATFGSVVMTKLANYFISISAGRIFAGEQKFFAISKDTPLAKEMYGKKQGDKISFNGQKMEILEIY